MNFAVWLSPMGELRVVVEAWKLASHLPRAAPSCGMLSVGSV